MFQDCGRPHGHHTWNAILRSYREPYDKADKFAKVNDCRNSVLCSVMHHSREDEPRTMEIRGHASRQCQSASSIHAVYFQALDRREEQLNWHNVVNESEIRWKRQFKMERRAKSSKGIGRLSSQTCQDASTI